MATTTARDTLFTVLHAGRERTITSPDAPFGVYPRSTNGYITTCSQCGAEACYYEVENGPERLSEWTGFVHCTCRAPFSPPDPWEAGMA